MNKEDLVDLGFYLVYDENSMPILMKNGKKAKVIIHGNGTYSEQLRVMVTGKTPMNYKQIIKLLQGD